MEIALVLAALVVTVVVLGVVAHLRREEVGRDDLVRCGDGPEVSIRDATLAAGGRSAWMRFGGGSG